jgi:Fanconi-associated nuclease 1
MFCDDYAGRSSGVPDLVVWNAELRIITFVEVKGPGDRPQENQKVPSYDPLLYPADAFAQLWFDTLLNAGADVEICKVLDINDKMDAASKSKKKAKGANRGSSKNARGKLNADSDVESEDEEDRLTSQPPTSSKPGPSSSRRKRTRPPDDYDNSLPVFPPDSSPTSPLAPTSRRASVGFSSKKQKLGP